MCTSQLLMFLLLLHILTMLLRLLNSMRILTMWPQLGICIKQDMKHMVHCLPPISICKILLIIISMPKPNTLCLSTLQLLSILLIPILLLIGMIHIDMMLSNSITSRVLLRELSMVHHIRWFRQTCSLSGIMGLLQAVKLQHLKQLQQT